MALRSVNYGHIVGKKTNGFSLTNFLSNVHKCRLQRPLLFTPSEKKSRKAEKRESGKSGKRESDSPTECDWRNWLLPGKLFMAK